MIYNFHLILFLIEISACILLKYTGNVEASENKTETFQLITVVANKVHRTELT